MEPFEFLLLFAALLLGVGLTDLATSLHRLLGAGSRVTWDWIAPLAAFVAFLKIVTQWWTWYGRAALVRSLTWEIFLAVLAGAILLFLLTATALPDASAPGERIDLREHWQRVHRRYWLLFLVHWLVAAGVTVYGRVAVHGAAVSPWPPGFVVAPITLTLAFVGNRWLQTIGLLIFAGVYVSQFFGQSLGG